MKHAMGKQASNVLVEDPENVTAASLVRIRRTDWNVSLTIEGFTQLKGSFRTGLAL